MAPFSFLPYIFLFWAIICSDDKVIEYNSRNLNDGQARNSGKTGNLVIKRWEVFHQICPYHLVTYIPCYYKKNELLLRENKHS